MKRLALLLACALPLIAEPRPSFSLDASAWKATDIVVASEGETVDGIFDVLEVWKGGLHAGERVTVPGMEAFANDERSRISPLWEPQKSERHVTGKEVVLFLGTTDEPHLSAVWIEDGRAYAFQQRIIPGETMLLSLDQTAEEVEDAVRAIVDVQRRFRDAESGQDILALMRAGIMQRQMVAELGERGPRATPALLAIIDDDSLTYMHQFALTALVRVAGRDAIPHLIRVLERELAHGADGDHYGTVYIAFANLHHLFAPEGRAIAEKWQKYLATHPLHDQLTETLDRYLRDIP